LRDEDSLIGVQLTDGESDLLLFTSAGKGIRINENDVRAMGRTAAGVRGIKIKPDDEVISLIAVESDAGQILFATENGYGKRTRIGDFSAQGRGGQGVISIQTSARNGRVVGAIKITGDEEVMLISNGGTLVRTPADDISILGRNTQGVTLIRLGNEEQLVQIEPVAASVDDNPDSDG
jgi:DNA gyrase subunit A